MCENAELCNNILLKNIKDAQEHTSSFIKITALKLLLSNYFEKTAI